MTNEEFQKVVLEKLGSLEHSQSSLAQGQKSLEQNQNTLAQGQKMLKQNQEELRQSMTRMENTMNDKFAALFDAREVQSDVNERILASLDRIESKIGKHDIQISVLDSKKHSRRK